MKKLYNALVFVILSVSAFCQAPLKDDSLQNYFLNHKDSLDPIEGIWTVYPTQEFYHHDTLYNVLKNTQDTKIAIIKKGRSYQSFNMNGEQYEAEFNSTDVKGVYLYRNYFPLIKKQSNPQAVIIRGGEMQYTYDYPEDYLRAQAGGAYVDGERVVNILKWVKTLPAK